MQRTELRQGPTLATIRLVEETIKKSDESVLKISVLKRRLPREVNHNALMMILDYLQESNKIAIGTKGVVWLSKGPWITKMLREGTEH